MSTAIRASRFTSGVSRFALPALLLALILSACAPKSGDPRPPEIVYGQDTCDECTMIISEARFAAATVLVQGGARKFDDIGDMLAYHAGHPELEVRAWFVHDYNSEGWLRAENAFYVRSATLHTPMGSALTAFEERAAAEAFAAEHGGQVFTFEQLQGQAPVGGHGN